VVGTLSFRLLVPDLRWPPPCTLFFDDLASPLWSRKSSLTSPERLFSAFTSMKVSIQSGAASTFQVLPLADVFPTLSARSFWLRPTCISLFVGFPGSLEFSGRGCFLSRARGQGSTLPAAFFYVLCLKPSVDLSGTGPLLYGRAVPLLAFRVFSALTTDPTPLGVLWAIDQFFSSPCPLTPGAVSAFPMVNLECPDHFPLFLVLPRVAMHSLSPGPTGSASVRYLCRRHKVLLLRSFGCLL